MSESQNRSNCGNLSWHGSFQWGCWWTVIRWILLNRSFFNVRKEKRSNCGILLPFGNFLKNHLMHLHYLLYTASWGWDRSTSRDGFDLIILKVIFKVGKVKFGPFFHNYWYYSVITKCCPNLLYLATLLWSQSCTKIWKVWNQKGPIWTFVIYLS